MPDWVLPTNPSIQSSENNFYGILEIENMQYSFNIDIKRYSYLWEATSSSSFLTPLRLSAPSLTRKDLQCSRSSAGTPLKLQQNIIPEVMHNYLIKATKTACSSNDRTNIKEQQRQIVNYKDKLLHSHRDWDYCSW